jgi:Protein of unknown function (DUF559)/Transcriptional regulator, AbiEi antitoxin
VTQCDIADTLSKRIVDTTASWQAAGVNAKQLRSLVRSGALVPVRRGVYATAAAVAFAAGSPCRSHALHVVGATLTAGRDSIASHQSAARIHGLDLLRPVPDNVVTLTRPPSRRTGRPGSRGIVFHTAALPSEHVTRSLGASVTTVARTVMDLARLLPFMDAVVTADSALRQGLSTKPELLRVADSCVRWPGVSQALTAVAFADARAESVLESCARVVFGKSGLEPADLQVTFRGPGYVYRGDFYWPAHRTIAEADGMAKYQDPQRAIDQIRRDRLLRDAGYKVVHFTWRELFETPEVVVARIRAAFAATTAF